MYSVNLITQNITNNQVTQNPNKTFKLCIIGPGTYLKAVNNLK